MSDNMDSIKQGYIPVVLFDEFYGDNLPNDIANIPAFAVLVKSMKEILSFHKYNSWNRFKYEFSYVDDSEFLKWLNKINPKEYKYFPYKPELEYNYF